MAVKVVKKMFPMNQVRWVILFKQSDKPWKRNKYSLDQVCDNNKVIIEAGLSSLDGQENTFPVNIYISFLNNSCYMVFYALDENPINGTMIYKTTVDEVIQESQQ